MTNFGVMSDSSDISNAGSASTATFTTALVFNAIVFGAQLGVFTLLRPRFKAIYEPRTYVGTGQHIAPLTPKPKTIAPLDKQNLRSFISTLFWPIALINADFRQIIKYNGLDAYFFVRFLRMMIKVFVPIWILSWAILLPITSVRTGTPGSDSLTRFTFGNVGTNQQSRYWAHLVCVWVFTFWILHVIRGEMTHFLITRQQHLTEKEHSESVQAKTILVTGIPKRYLTQTALRALFQDLPGGVKQIWINRDLKELPEFYDRREKACNKLEGAEVALMRTALKIKLAESKAAAKGKSPKIPAKNDSRDSTTDLRKGAVAAGEDAEVGIEETVVPRDKRPMHKTGFLGLFGTKVDSIEWCREEIATCNKALDEGRNHIATADFDLVDGADLQGGAVDKFGNPIGRARKADTWKDVDGDGEGDVLNVKGVIVDGVMAAVGGVKDAPGRAVKGAVGGVQGAVTNIKGAAFITFNRQIAAHLAFQSLAHHMPYTMTGRYIEVAPSDVIHANLNLNPYEQKIRLAISYAATAGLILLWAFPVAFVGVVSNIKTVCTQVVWLSWICTLPPVVVGIISGILPPRSGIPKYTGLELSLMTRFFLFQVLHSFLIVTLSSGIIASLKELLNNPTSIPSTLAQGLPKASTFFLTYIILQGLAGAAGGFLQIVRLIVYYVKLVLLGSTPRNIYAIKYTPGSVAWGTLFPGITLITVIGLAYSIISPIINGLAVLAFFLFYQLYKYLFLYVLQQDKRQDTGGLFFPKAIQHVFVGLYLQHICLAALFFLARDTDKKATSVPQGALMIVLIVLTAGFHAILNSSYEPLIVALPLSLKDRVGRGVSVEEAKVDVDEVGEEDGEAGVSPLDAEAGRASGINEERRIHPKARDGHAASTEDGHQDGSDVSHASGAARKDKKIAALMEDKEKSELERYGFAHPAASRPQRTVWIPHFTPRFVNEKTGETEVDEFVEVLHGMGERQTQACVEAGVDARERGARMDGKGKIEVDSGPPGYTGL
ncbi:hypothetical protein DFP72DRAFT_871593 [Ephemerocybe angulata]|uniref:DUF221-domain-containing protein n=1 Tax=Ephemerocybe angulata TaxID=980116 RepID=A0A8H6IHN9_9AGAR|nr:hypothetical protein DFP72DRAFT_871593 [Tulosesus angulatus]